MGLGSRFSEAGVKPGDDQKAAVLLEYLARRLKAAPFISVADTKAEEELAKSALEHAARLRRRRGDDPAV